MTSKGASCLRGSQLVCRRFARLASNGKTCFAGVCQRQTALLIWFFLSENQVKKKLSALSASAVRQPSVISASSNPPEADKLREWVVILKKNHENDHLQTKIAFVAILAVIECQRFKPLQRAASATRLGT
jgi:hypothetical protein